MSSFVTALIVIAVIAAVIFAIVVAVNKAFNGMRQRPRRSETDLRGEYGEKLVARKLERCAAGEHFVITNYTFWDEGKSVQIDHILIDERGVFVIETKNISGEIFGKEDQFEWTQVLAGGRIVHKLYNPVRQNAAHLYHLRHVLPKTHLEPLVVFVQDNTEHVPFPSVVPFYRLKKVLNAYPRDVLSSKQITGIYERLMRAKADISKQEHVQQIYQMKQNIAMNVCPRCGGNLVLRTGKYSEFYGCSNYPKCEFTKNIK